MPDRDDMITLTDAIATYGHTRAWWYEQARGGFLTLYDIPGDRNTYLSRSEIDAYIQPRPRSRSVEPGAKDETA